MIRPRNRSSDRGRFLIVTADDFGLHEAVNEAVERASAAGVLTAASLMAGGAGFSDAVQRARRLPQLRVGLHVVLAGGTPVLPPRVIPALVDRDGRFRDGLFAGGVRLFALPRVRSQAAAEIRAQFERFARTGLLLDHVNAHMHFHVHPTLLSLLLKIGREFGMRAVRVPGEPLWMCRYADAPLAALGGAAALSPWISAMRHRVRANGFACADHVFGIARTGCMDEATLLRILARLPPGVTEIYLHPATRNASVAGSSRTYWHARELTALLSPRVSNALARSGAIRGGYSDLLPIARGDRAVGLNFDTDSAAPGARDRRAHTRG